MSVEALKTPLMTLLSALAKIKHDIKCLARRVIHTGYEDDGNRNKPVT